MHVAVFGGLSILFTFNSYLVSAQASCLYKSIGFSQLWKNSTKAFPIWEPRGAPCTALLRNKPHSAVHHSCIVQELEKKHALLLIVCAYAWPPAAAGRGRLAVPCWQVSLCHPLCSTASHSPAAARASPYVHSILQGSKRGPLHMGCWMFSAVPRGAPSQNTALRWSVGTRVAAHMAVGCS